MTIFATEWNNIWLIVFLYGIIINTFAVVQMGIDKGRAVRREYRISEKQLLVPVLLGGMPGVMVGSVLFRHKTQKRSFQYKFAISNKIFASVASGVILCGLSYFMHGFVTTYLI
ncbi:MAG: DUF1294 domain-containing protein [Pseudomonadota bacterium]